MPLACAVLLVVAGFASRRLRAARPPRSERGLERSGFVATQRLPLSQTDGGSIRELWRDSRLFRLLFVSLLCSGLLGLATTLARALDYHLGPANLASDFEVFVVIIALLLYQFI